MAQRGDTSARWRYLGNAALTRRWACAFLGVLLAACNHLGTPPEVQAPPPRAAAPAPTPAPQAPPTPPATATPAPVAVPPTPANAEPARSPAAAPEQPVVVGLLLPLSGPARPLGMAMQRAAEIAFFDLAGPRLTLRFYDTGGTAEGATTATRAALDAGAELLLGPVFAPAVRAAADARGDAAVPILAFSNDAPVAGDGVFILGPRPEEQIARVLSHAADQGMRRLGVFLPANLYGDLVRETVAALAPQLGISVTRTAFFEPGAPDAPQKVRAFADFPRRKAALQAERKALAGRSDAISKRALKRLEGLDSLGDPPYEAVLLPVGGAELRRLAPHFAYYDIDPRRVRYLGTALWNDPTLSTEPALRSGVFAALSPDNGQPFKERYQKAFDTPPPGLAALAFDAVSLAAVLQLSAEPVAATAFTLPRLTQAGGFSGVTGLFRLLPNGLNQRGLALMTITADGLDTLNPAPSRFDDLTN